MLITKKASINHAVHYPVQYQSLPSVVLGSQSDWGFGKNSPEGKTAAALGDEGQCQLRHTISDAE